MKKYIVGLLSIVLIAGGGFFGWWKINKEESFERKNKVTLTGQLEDKDGKLLSNQEIELSYKKEEIKVKTDNSGYFYTHIEKNKEYDLSSKELEGTILAKNDDAVKTTMKKGSYFSGKKIDTDDTVTVLRNKAIELDPDNFIYEVASDYREVTIFSGKEKNEKLDFLIGDIIAIPAQVDYISGLGLKIIAIEKESDNYILTTEQAAVEDVLKSFETKGDGYEIDVKDAYLELGDDVQLLDEGQQGVAWEKPKIKGEIDKSLTDEIKLKYPKEKTNNQKKKITFIDPEKSLLEQLTFEITNKVTGKIKIEALIDFDQLDKATVLTTNSVELATDIKVALELLGMDDSSEKIELYKFKIPPIGPYIGIEIPISAKMDAAGTISLSKEFELPRINIESEAGLKKGELIKPADSNIFLSGNKEQTIPKLDNIKTSFDFGFGIGVGAKIKALSVVPIISFDVFGGPKINISVTDQRSDNTHLVEGKVYLMNLSFGIDPQLFGPVIKNLVPSVKVSEYIELYSKKFGETSDSLLIIGDYNDLLSVMDKAENLVNTEESIDSEDYRELVSLVKGEHERNEGITFEQMRAEFEKILPSVLTTNGKKAKQLFTTQKAINEFTEYIEELLSTVAIEIEETSKSSSKNFDQLPQATQFVVISSLLDSRLTNLIYDGPEVFNNGGTIGATYYEDTQRFSFQAHSGAGVGHPIIDWEIRENDVLFIQSIHRSSFDEYEKKLPKNEVSGSISKSDLFELYERYAEHYDKWGAGTSVKKESIDPKEYLNESEAMSEKTTIREIILPSIDDIELTEK